MFEHTPFQLHTIGSVLVILDAYLTHTEDPLIFYTLLKKRKQTQSTDLCQIV